MDVILKMLGVWREKSGHVVGMHLSYDNPYLPLWLVLFIGTALVVLTFVLYHLTAAYVSPAKRWTLAILRGSFLFLLLALVLHPILTITVAGAVRQTLLVVIDKSGSMGVNELRSEPDDITRAAIARGEVAPDAGLSVAYKAPGDTHASRIDLAKAALTNDKMNLIPRLEEQYDIQAFTFDRSVKEITTAAPPVKEESTVFETILTYSVVISLIAIVGGVALLAFVKPRVIGSVVAGIGVAVFALCLLGFMARDRMHSASNLSAEAVKGRTEWVGKIDKADGTSTAVGEAIRDVIDRKRGRGAAGLLLITDGVNNAGVSPLKMVSMAKAEGLPIYTYGVGITSPRDIAVSNEFVDPVTFVKDEVPVSVRVQAQGLKGQKATLVLKLGDAQVDSREISLDDDEQTVNMKFNPQKVGDFDLTASIEPRKDEVIKDNNQISKHLRVIDGRIKVLHIEQLPRWEFKYLQAQLMRDRRVEYKCMLLEADPGVSDLPNSPYLKKLPAQLADLANEKTGYDVVILGDVDPKRLTPAFMEALNGFVARAGGSVIMMAGKRFSPTAYRKTPVENMLPVEFDAPVVEMMSAGGNEKPIKLELTEAGKASMMMRLADKDDESLKRWAQLPPIYWEARVARPKPAAEVLLVDPDPARQSRYGKLPVMAVQQYGMGSVLYVGTDNTWRWRKNLNEQDFTRLWGQIVERMALAHMLGASKRTQLSTDKQTYATGDRVTVFARLYKEANFEPVTDATVNGFYQPRDKAAALAGAAGTVVLRALPDQPGMYRGEFVATNPGSYALGVETDKNASLDFSVNNQTIELTHTAMDEKGLTQLAVETGGKFFREEDLNAMPDTISSTARQKQSNIPVEFGFSPLFFLLLMALVTTEWIVRKLCQLK